MGDGVISSRATSAQGRIPRSRVDA